MTHKQRQADLLSKIDKQIAVNRTEMMHLIDNILLLIEIKEEFQKGTKEKQMVVTSEGRRILETLQTGSTAIMHIPDCVVPDDMRPGQNREPLTNQVMTDFPADMVYKTDNLDPKLLINGVMHEPLKKTDPRDNKSMQKAKANAWPFPGTTGRGK